jgi:rSAM/selenodomain-associated transferase 2
MFRNGIHGRLSAGIMSAWQPSKLIFFELLVSALKCNFAVTALRRRQSFELGYESGWWCYNETGCMISVIIPTYNEVGHVGRTIELIKQNDSTRLIAEIIVVDGGSQDKTVVEAREAGAIVISSKKGRAAQMNAGAKLASGSVLYFLHADTIPPKSFAIDITACTDKGIASGCYQLKFDLDHWFLKANTWFTRFDVDAFRYGDQSFFIRRDIFNKIGGFCEKHTIMEDQEIIRRAKQNGPFKVLDGTVITSARKYVENGVFQMQAIFYLLYIMYKMGFSQNQLLAVYKSLITQNKL